ncbi:MAG TPA: 4a-hydroxytetrahydrobiopterin dehydratase [Acidimicrobiia bacterium]|nr:4a-hydroxytetrahydrobiopterin dehydratase [Acidimicrobiia bacterium]
MHAPLDAAQIAESLAALPAWARDDDTIVRTYELDSFAAAIAFVVRIGFLAEAADHHPDLDVRWRKVHVALTTHDAGGITAQDFALARQIEGLV